MKFNAKKVVSLFNKYKNKLRLDDCRIWVGVANKFIITDGKGEMKVGDSGNYARVERGELKDYTMVLDSTTPEGIKDTVLHEMLHIFLWEILILATSVLELSDFSTDMKKKIREKMDEEEHKIMEKLIELIK